MSTEIPRPERTVAFKPGALQSCLSQIQATQFHVYDVFVDALFTQGPFHLGKPKMFMFFEDAPFTRETKGKRTNHHHSGPNP